MQVLGKILCSGGRWQEPKKVVGHPSPWEASRHHSTVCASVLPRLQRQAVVTRLDLEHCSMGPSLHCKMQLGRGGQCWPIPLLTDVPPPTTAPPLPLRRHLQISASLLPFFFLSSAFHSIPSTPLSLPSTNPSEPPSSFLDTRKEGKDYHLPLPLLLGTVEFPPAIPRTQRLLQPCSSDRTATATEQDQDGIRCRPDQTWRRERTADRLGFNRHKRGIETPSLYLNLPSGRDSFFIPTASVPRHHPSPHLPHVTGILRLDDEESLPNLRSLAAKTTLKVPSFRPSLVHSTPQFTLCEVDRYHGSKGVENIWNWDPSVTFRCHRRRKEERNQEKKKESQDRED